MRPDITFDNIIFSLQSRGGISSYWRHLLTEMSGLAAGMHFARSTNHLRLSRYLPMWTGKRRGLFHSSYYRSSMKPGVRNIVTVYDFVYERFRSGPALFVHTAQKRQALRRADGIICISDSARRDMFEFCGDVVQDKPVEVIHLGVSRARQGRVPVDNVNMLKTLPGAYLLYVGARNGYKNFRILRALAESGELRRRGLLVVCAGGEPAAPEDLHQDIQFLGSVSDDILAALYQKARGLVYTSLYEGFGLPLLEAMSHGCPVISSGASSLPEAGGPAALYFDAADPGALAKAVDDLERPGVRERLQVDGKKRAASFTWEVTAQKHLQFYSNISA